MERKVCPGEFYRHFKNKLYQIIAVAVHSETGEQMVVYQALYGDYKVYVRPYDMFVSEVDHEKYPEVAQRYRFTRVEPGVDDRGDDAGTYGESGAEAHAGAGVTDWGADTAAALRSSAAHRKEPNPDLVAFLDAEEYNARMECLAKLAGSATQSDLNALYVVLDMQEQDGPIAVQIDHIRRYLAAQNRYDGARLR